MTPEQRHELIERKLQGITETVQIIADMQRDNEKRFAELGRIVGANDDKLRGITETVQIIADMQRDNEKRFAENEKRSVQTGQRLDQLTHIIETEHESIKSLERIALAHEQRLDGIQGH